MVAPAISHRDSLSADLLRGIARAAAAHIVVYRKTATTLGVATVDAGIWTERAYTLTITGDGAGELACNCRARAGRPGVQTPFRRHRRPSLGVYAVPPRRRR